MEFPALINWANPFQKGLYSDSDMGWMRILDAWAVRTIHCFGSFYMCINRFFYISPYELSTLFLFWKKDKHISHLVSIDLREMSQPKYKGLLDHLKRTLARLNRKFHTSYFTLCEELVPIRVTLANVKFTYDFLGVKFVLKFHIFMDFNV